MYTRVRSNIKQGHKSCITKRKHFVYQQALIRTLHTIFLLQNSLWEFTTQENTFKMWFCTQKQGLNAVLKLYGIQK